MSTIEILKKIAIYAPNAASLAAGAIERIRDENPLAARHAERAALSALEDPKAEWTIEDRKEIAGLIQSGESDVWAEVGILDPHDLLEITIRMEDDHYFGGYFPITTDGVDAAIRRVHQAGAQHVQTSLSNDMPCNMMRQACKTHGLPFKSIADDSSSSH